MQSKERFRAAYLIGTMAKPFDWDKWAADFDVKMTAFNATIARHKAELEALEREYI